MKNPSDLKSRERQEWTLIADETSDCGEATAAWRTAAIEMAFTPQTK